MSHSEREHRPGLPLSRGHVRRSPHTSIRAPGLPHHLLPFVYRLPSPRALRIVRTRLTACVPMRLFCPLQGTARRAPTTLRARARTSSAPRATSAHTSARAAPDPPRECLATSGGKAERLGLCGAHNFNAIDQSRVTLWLRQALALQSSLLSPTAGGKGGARVPLSQKKHCTVRTPALSMF